MRVHVFWAAFALVVIGVIFFALGAMAAGHAALWPGILLFIGIGFAYLVE